MHRVAPQRVRFGPFEADLKAGELRKRGRRVRLQRKPFEVLEALLQQPGEAMTRQELCSRLWPGDEFGDFDQGLNNAVNKLRAALGDSAADPRFIETVGRGYRFIGVLEEAVAPPPPAAPDPGPAAVPVAGARPVGTRRLAALAGGVLVVLVAAAASTRTRTDRGPGAYELYLQGQFHLQRASPAAYALAVEYYEQALALDPRFAPAHAGLALARLRQEVWGYEPLRSQSDQVKAAVLKALALDPTLAEAHALLGVTLRYYDWDWLGSEAAFERALRLNPRLSLAHAEYCILLQELARFDEAVDEARQTVALDPRVAASWALEGRALYRARRYHEAESSYLRALELEPGFGFPLEQLTELYLAERRFDDARRVFGQLEQLPSHRQLGPLRAQLEAATGNAAAARRLLDDAGDPPFPKGPKTAAVVLTLLHEPDRAFAVLDRAVDTRMIWPMQLSDPGLDPLRRDPRFLRLLARTGLPRETVQALVQLPLLGRTRTAALDLPSH